MLPGLLEFIDLLRKNRVRVSTAESLDAVAAAQAVGLSQPDNLRAALLATLIKRTEDEAPFTELFDLYFRRPAALLRAQEAPLMEALRQRGLSEDELEHLLAILADEAARLDPTARSGMGLRRGDVESLIRLAGLSVDWGRLQSPLQVGYFTQQVLEQLRFRQAQEALGMGGRLGGRLQRALGAERAEEVLGLMQDNLQRLRGAVRQHVQDEFQRRNVQFTQEFRQQLLEHKPFGQMTEDELRRLRTEVERLARKLRAAASLRRRQVRRGRLDLRQTLRRSLRSGGVPFDLRWRKRRKDRPRLVVLCDISDSVRHVSRFMLQLAYTLQELFDKVRSYVFVSDLAETTALFQRHELHRAVDLAYGGAVVNVHANSNYGRALSQFVDRHMGAVTSKTTVLVIGDGRNNYHAAEAWALGRVRARAKYVLWLNPEPPLSWGFGDSAMREYEAHTSRIETVNNLASLKRVIDELVL